MAKKDFKGLGSSILGDVLGDTPANGSSANAPMHKTGAGEMCNPDVRLHVYISQELEDLLIEEVYRRKRDNKTPNSQASKRAVVEDALGCYLYRSRKGKS